VNVGGKPEDKKKLMYATKHEKREREKNLDVGEIIIINSLYFLIFTCG